MPLTSTPHDLKSGAALLASQPIEQQEKFLNDLSENAIMALPYLFDFWAFDHQRPPEGDWRSWVIMGGRGAGKTRAGAEWVRSMVEGARPLEVGRAKRMALVGETVDQVREVMIFGESGILASSPPDRRPEWQATRKRLLWPNGAIAQVFSAHDPESLRGPQFDAAWLDELAKWKKAEETWDMLQFALQLGDYPQQCITTTPKNIPLLKTILQNDSTVITTAPTEANSAYLAKGFLDEVRARYAGTRLGRQELDGVLLDDMDGALWTAQMIDACKGEIPDKLDRIVVAVDPPVTGTKNSDECGIVVVGATYDGDPTAWKGYVLADYSIRGKPSEWARASVNAYHEFGADRVIAEVNQGGDLVEDMIRQQDPLISYQAVRARHGKTARAEPVAALYEQGRITHGAQLSALEDQMAQMTTRGFMGRSSPDRVDALVWGLQELLIAPVARWRKPQVRTL
ncbi:MAG: DNA-packaging protein [Halocynthiibacter sp.]